MASPPARRARAATVSVALAGLAADTNVDLRTRPAAVAAAPAGADQDLRRREDLRRLQWADCHGRDARRDCRLCLPARHQPAGRAARAFLRRPVLDPGVSDGVRRATHPSRRSRRGHGRSPGAVGPGMGLAANHRFVAGHRRRARDGPQRGAARVRALPRHGRRDDGRRAGPRQPARVPRMVERVLGRVRPLACGAWGRTTDVSRSVRGQRAGGILCRGHRSILRETARAGNAARGVVRAAAAVLPGRSGAVGKSCGSGFSLDYFGRGSSNVPSSNRFPPRSSRTLPINARAAFRTSSWIAASSSSASWLVAYGS